MEKKTNKGCRLKGVDTVGGQAIVEGVMIRSPNAVAMAVRRNNGNIVVRSECLKSRPKKSIWKKPFFRGIAILGSTLVLGMKAINFSASIMEEDLRAEEEKRKKQKQNKKKKFWSKKREKKNVKNKKKKGLSPVELIFSIAIAIGMVIVLYKVIPLWIAGLFKKASPLFSNTVTFNLVDAIVKSLILVFVMWSFSLFKDVRRMYEYHGAEHMSVFTYEADKSLTVDNATKYGTLHPRCGTNFLILVFLVSLFFFLAIDPDLPFLWKLIPRILLLPIIAGVTYEIIRFGSKHMDKALIRILMLPGLWLQKITTKKPDKDQLRVALEAVKEVLNREKDKIRKVKIFEIEAA
jgi:uncharacterized protein YqhQ